MQVRLREQVRLRKLDIIIATSCSISFALLIILYILFPSIVYDRFIWKYFWGPVVADAVNHEVSYRGVVAREGYTLVSEIVYGLIALTCIYYIYRLLKFMKLPIDWKFLLSLFPFILLGPVTRVLEDGSYFKIPLTYCFISPIIYVQIACYVLIFLLLSWLMERKTDKILPTGIGLLLLPPVGYLILWFHIRDLVLVDINPLFTFVISIVVILVFVIRRYRGKKFDIREMLLLAGATFLSYSICPIIYSSEWLPSTGTRLDFFTLTLGLVSIIVFSLFFACKHKESLRVLSDPLNVSMIFAHLLDGITSYISIYDPFNLGLPSYGEKHPIPLKLMEISEGVLYPIVKFALIILIIYLLDVAYTENSKKHLDFINILKIGIFILGIAPGTRDLLRVTVGI